MKGYAREKMREITADRSALRKCRNAVSAGVLSPISSAVGRNGAVGDKRNARAGARNYPCAAVADNSEGRIGCAGRVAIIKSRPLRREAPQWVGVPVGHGYNYFLACDTAERIIFAGVTGSGSGKLCWHSRGTDNDQENAGYVRENGQRRTGIAR